MPSNRKEVHVSRLSHTVNEKIPMRSEEHTSELQSRGQLVCRLLLEKKKDNYIQLRPHTKRQGTIYLIDIDYITVTHQSYQKNIKMVLNNEQAYCVQL